jgi:hypothetical protein
MRVSRLMLAPALLVAAGCMQGQRVIKVNADGSGTIVDTVKLGEQAKSMLASMESMDKTPAAEKKAKKDGKLKAQATAMGEGVTFVSLQNTKDGPKSKTSATPAPAPKPEELQQAITMMKGMMAGLKMTTLLQVNGKVVKTNSPYAAGSDVTLLEVDFDQLDEAGLKKLAASGKDMPSPAALKGVKGLKVNEREVIVEFK